MTRCLGKAIEEFEIETVCVGRPRRRRAAPLNAAERGRSVLVRQRAHRVVVRTFPG